jgi:LuxR family maltose regulon positive regulatory protein
MMTGMIKTKLNVPPLRHELVPRPQLKVRLDGVLRRSLALISAPVGFGKTTLVTSWIKEHEAYKTGAYPFKLAWLSLDEYDNDPVRFWFYVAAALQVVLPELSEDLTSLQQARNPVSIESLLMDLLNALSAVSDPVVLVLDDYHLIEDQDIHDNVALFLEHLPPHVHLIIITRRDPPLKLSRLRGQNMLVEVRQEDLVFSEVEAAQFLKNVMGLSLTDKAVSVLAEQTEGWIAGLQLAALSMRDMDDIDDFLNEFSGGHRYIVDYLLEEVWQYQSPHIQTFLLQTAVLDELCAPLCERVMAVDLGDDEIRESGLQSLSERYACQAILESLERGNLFVVPLDESRQWYRYHHLFADLLRKRLAQIAPERLPRLHDLAASWYEENGRFPEAIGHYLQGNQHKAATLILEIAESYMMRSELKTLLDWLGALNHETMEERPLLFVYLAGVSLLAGKTLRTVESQLQEALDHGQVKTSAEVNVLRGLIAAFRGDTSASENLSQKALQLLPTGSLFLRSLVVQNMALNQIIEGDVNKIIPDLLAAADVCAQAGNVMSEVVCLAHAGEISIAAGQLWAAQEYYEQAMKKAVDGRGRPLPILGIAKMGLGEVFREWNRLDEAAALSEAGLSLIQRWGQIGGLDGYIWAANIKQAQGDTAGALEALRLAAELAVRFDASQIDDDLVGLFRARLNIQQGRIDTAKEWLEKNGLLDADFPKTPYHLWELGCLTLIYLAIARQEWVAALARIAELTPYARNKGRQGIVIDLLTLKSIAHYQGSQLLDAHSALEQALRLAAPEQYTRIFIDKGTPLKQLLLTLQKTDLSPNLRNYAAYLLTNFEPAFPSAPPDKQQQIPIPDPLSDRELEVLGLIAMGYTNRQIADQLYIARSTVKTHINHIYSKLGVSSRTEAVKQAHSLGLIS